MTIPPSSKDGSAHNLEHYLITLRQRRWTMAHIAAELRISRATVSRVLARVGLSRLAALDPAPLPRRYERARPGELLHMTENGPDADFEICTTKTNRPAVMPAEQCRAR
jgi:hypothetical protein